MNASIYPAVGALIGAIIGAASSIFATRSLEKRKWQREIRTNLISLVTIGLLSGDRAKAVDMKLALGQLGTREQLLKFLDAPDSRSIADSMNEIVLSAINTERQVLGLGPLELRDINRLIMGAHADDEGTILRSPRSS